MHINRIRIQSSRFPDRGCYPYSLRVLQKTPVLELDTAVTFFAGENGSGKSTLLEAIARACGIYIWQGDTRARASNNPHEKNLHRCLEITWSDGRVPGSFFSAGLFQNFTRILDEWAASDPGVLEYFGGHSLMTQSHGQGHMSFFRSRFALKGLYLLDEPESALSPRTQKELLDVIKETSSGGEAQFIIATHSPILLSCPGAEIVSFDSAPLKKVAYRDTDHYRVYKEFFT